MSGYIWNMQGILSSKCKAVLLSVPVFMKVHVATTAKHHSVKHAVPITILYWK